MATYRDTLVPRLRSILLVATVLVLALALGCTSTPEPPPAAEPAAKIEIDPTPAPEPEPAPAVEVVEPIAGAPVQAVVAAEPEPTPEPTPTPTPIPTDREILAALYHATDGPNWVNQENWLSDRTLGEWHGVTTDAEGRVTHLDFFDRTNPESHGLKPESTERK